MRWPGVWAGIIAMSNFAWNDWAIVLPRLAENKDKTVAHAEGFPTNVLQKVLTAEVLKKNSLVCHITWIMTLDDGLWPAGLHGLWPAGLCLAVRFWRGNIYFLCGHKIYCSRAQSLTKVQGQRLYASLLLSSFQLIEWRDWARVFV